MHKPFILISLNPEAETVVYSISLKMWDLLHYFKHIICFTKHKEKFFFLHIIGISVRKRVFILDVLSKVELWEGNWGGGGK